MSAGAVGCEVGAGVLASTRARAERTVARARAEGRGRWLAISIEEPPGRDPLAFFDRCTEADRFYWAHPTADFAMAAAGRCAAIEVAGRDRFARAGALARDLFDRLDAECAADPEDGPLLVGGFAFDDAAPDAPEWRGFPSGLWVLPEILFRSRAGRSYWTLCAAVAPSDDPEALASRLFTRLAAVLASPPGRVVPLRHRTGPDFRIAASCSLDDYCGRTRTALAAIARGELEKVVLARSIRLEATECFEPARVLASLRRAHPSCVSFAIARGEAVFLGATPERLLRLDGRSGAFETGALAGSAPRGRSPAEDARLASALRESKKEQSEHAAVVRAIRDSLRPLCGELSGPEAPRCLGLDGIQHLYTPLRGQLAARRRGRGALLELVGHLHPTPAVAGSPTDAARAWIRRREGLERGWYAAPVGYVDADGGGEMRVALRSALLAGGSAHLYAGAGIVAGSDPERELRETRLKLRTLLAPLLEV